jgi:uncharacterized protein (TIGR03083 family)
MTTDMWLDVVEERKALMELLDSLTPEQWDARSLCTEWRVRDVVGHMVSETQMTVARLAVGMIASGFRINQYIAKDARRRGTASVPEILRDYRAMLSSRRHLPGLSSLSMLEDIVVHQLDIRRPLDRSRSVPERRMIVVASELLANRFFPGAKLFQDLRVTANDADWSAGDGPEVAGPIEALVLTLSGRYVALDELQGDGVATMRHRAAQC